MDEQTKETETFLNGCWSLYFHNPDDSDWSICSYKKVCDISSAEDWIKADVCLHDMWDKGMFFLMREHIQPMWEDEENKDGGCISFKVNKPDAKEYWFQLGCKVLGEVLKKDRMGDRISGVSISPKRNFCILRIWCGSVEIGSPDLFHLEAPHYSQVMFKPHMVQKDFAKAAA